MVKLLPGLTLLTGRSAIPKIVPFAAVMGRVRRQDITCQKVVDVLLGKEGTRIDRHRKTSQ